HRLAQHVDAAVRAGTDRDLVGRDAVTLGERGVQAEGAAVRVAVQVARRALHRLGRSRERAERALVRGQLDHALEPELALHVLDRLARLVRRQRVDARPKERVAEIGEPAASSLFHAATLPGVLPQVDTAPSDGARRGAPGLLPTASLVGIGARVCAGFVQERRRRARRRLPGWGRARRRSRSSSRGAAAVRSSSSTAAPSSAATGTRSPVGSSPASSRGRRPAGSWPRRPASRSTTSATRCCCRIRSRRSLPRAARGSRVGCSRCRCIRTSSMSPTAGNPGSTGSTTTTAGATWPERARRSGGPRPRSRSGDTSPRRSLPVVPELGLFPLPIVLVPTERIPLHIFEPRYRDLIHECVETGVEFGLVLATGDGAVHEIGTRAGVVDVLEELEDGRMNIVVEGRERFRLLELTRGRTFQTGIVEPVHDEAEPASPEDTARALAIFRELAEIAESDVDVPEPDSPQLVWELAARVDFGVDPKQEILASTSPAQRIRRLAELLESSLEAVRLEKTLRDRAGRNGKVSPIGDED